MSDGVDPGGADVLQRLAETGAVDRAVGGKTRDQHGDIETAAFRIRRLREQKGLAVRLSDAPAILPAHQRVHFGVLVDRLVDDLQQALARQRQHMLMQVGIAPFVLGRTVAIAFERGVKLFAGALVHQLLMRR